MSNLLSSFIIEPVFRQARRLSGTSTGAASSTQREQRLSHARPSTAPDIPSSLEEPRAAQNEDEIPSSASLDCLRDSSADSVAADGIVGNAREREWVSRDDAAAPRNQSVTVNDDEFYEGAFRATRGADLQSNADKEDSGRSDTESVSSSDADTGGVSLDGSAGSSWQSQAGGVGPSQGLPENDGMQDMRQNLHRIKELGLSAEDMARRMHQLMTEAYYASKGPIGGQRLSNNVNARHSAKSSSSISTTSNSGPTASPSVASLQRELMDSYNLAPEDMVQVFRPRHTISEGMFNRYCDDGVEDDSELQLGCEHYQRNVKVQCCDCRRWYPCRHCHDEQEDHELNRQKTTSMLCMLCCTPQPARQYCEHCGQRAAWYYCDICKFWDDDGSQKTYHCPDCGLCRRGEGIGKDFFHCKVCDRTDCLPSSY
jgi:hypothetical protein